ncbi:alpha/beta hydrolase family protein [Nocardioides massiliensis]|uniref:Acetyl esterase/lipase n=1 Tax=Nocardioides massiliensis TaxID=1325935 RepID=A0ABT9NKQ9_9ACTN|nr:alpha/beta hydrolase [Nocardioides massiliensis]MDP9820983.1 acetyl esterase/lipase [Nocardioides massiliensis]
MDPDLTLRYADHDDALVDVHLPPALRAAGSRDAAATPPAPVVLLIHGGFWRVAYDRTHTRPMARAFADAGAVVLTPEYRRVGGVGRLAGGWPHTFDDVDAAYAVVPNLLAGAGVRPTSLTVAGHSAGGHLALWLANQAGAGRPVIDRVVGLAPVGDLQAAYDAGLGDGAVQALLGGRPEDHPERYAAADPALRMGDRPRSAVVVVHGEDDDIVPLANSEGLVARRPWIELVRAPGGHFGVITPDSAAWPRVVAAVLGSSS